MPNILLIAAGQTDHDDIHYALHTSRFVGRNASAAAERVWLDTFQWQRTESNSRRTAAFRRNVHLFPDKLHNLEGRLVRLAMFNYKPYSVWVEVVSGGVGAGITGPFTLLILKSAHLPPIREALEMCANLLQSI